MKNSPPSSPRLGHMGVAVAKVDSRLHGNDKSVMPAKAGIQVEM